ncbi:putative nuclease of restriction endonuclease-like (RecB) superfamily [Prosthecobacter fusiformis]|uniref:Putative nuclease of restriction endonuclease-like (RecB) superfamily n=1 Tax=Prosthecobacter fusiformis TaxID=48464 RepID=A0A4R7RJV7_9BACT|nr:PDDEXK nuclease domain-containing protein [Prosthecobacter fusiformis]TDU62457.1 putative nuclease of restriction endonuclease-like (RecB) superfamily [Prosthecobacter fusiformis]
MKQKTNGLTEPPDDYAGWLVELKARIHTARQRATLAVNRELVLLYWQIGRDILARQAAQGWGAKVIERLAHDLRTAFPEMKGFSRANLMYMRAFAEAWPEGKFVQQPVAQLGKEAIVQQAVGQIEPWEIVHQAGAQFEVDGILQAPLAQLPWGHHCVLLDKLKTRDDRYWYLRNAIEHNWSRNILVMQIESRLLERSGAAVTNFNLTLPKPQSDLARESLKDPYRFDFLGLTEEAQEREIENALVKHVTDFLLELGAGFAFVGRQVLLDVGGEEFFMDLLFYHLKLRCYVVIELKAGKFKPEHLGQLSFYLTAVDAQVKHPQDAPTIGLLLCKSKNKVVAEYALRDKAQPLGVAEYQLVESLPPELQTSLPSIEQIESELAGDDLPDEEEKG